MQVRVVLRYWYWTESATLDDDDLAEMFLEHVVQELLRIAIELVLEVSICDLNEACVIEVGFELERSEKLFSPAVPSCIAATSWLEDDLDNLRLTVYFRA